MQKLINEILSNSKTIAVIGVKNDINKESFKIPNYLFNNGFIIYPINPKLCGLSLFNVQVYDKITSINDRIDTVVFFRKPEFLVSHTNEILKMNILPKYVWFQLGITNNIASSLLEDKGIYVIQNRCIMIEHLKLKKL